MYDLRSYELLYSLDDKSVSEVKISPGIMLVIHNATSSVPLKILNIEDGTVLKVRWDVTYVPVFTLGSLAKHDAL